MPETSGNIDTPSRRLPKQARSIERVERIMAATQKLLVEGGYAAITTRSIASAANVPVGSVYQYFSDKNDILSHLHKKAYSEVMTRTFAAANTLDTSRSLKETMKALLLIFWGDARSHESFLALTRWYNAVHPVWQVVPSYEGGLGKMVATMIDRSGIPVDKDRKEIILQTSVASMSVLIDLAIEERDPERATRQIEEIANLLSSYLKG